MIFFFRTLLVLYFLHIFASSNIPGGEKKGARIHDLSQRESRVVGRSDAVLHHFGEAKPNRNGCIVVPPFIPNAFYMCETLPGFDSCWAASPKDESEMDEFYSPAKELLDQIKIIQKRRSPIQIKCRQAFALLKGVCGWMGMGPWGNGILSEIETPRNSVGYAFKKIYHYKAYALFPAPGFQSHLGMEF